MPCWKEQLASVKASISLQTLALMIRICLLRQLKAQLLSSQLPHKVAQTAQIQVANITGRFLYFQTVTNLVDSSQVWKVSLCDKIVKLHDDLAFYEERHGC